VCQAHLAGKKAAGRNNIHAVQEVCEMAARIVVVGSINVDLVIQAPSIPEPGETVIGQDLKMVPGGKGANQAVAAARLGSAVSLVGRLGDDDFGARLKRSLSAAKVNQGHLLETENSASGVALIVVDQAGENSIVVAPGANALVTPADVEAAADTIAAADVLLLQLEIPLPPVLRAAELAHEHGVRVILNPAPARALPAELLALVDILIPNESETAILSGLPTVNQSQIAIAAARLRDLGVGSVILTLGERGALLVQERGLTRFPAFAVDRVVDTTAAGDAFVAGVGVAIAEGRSLQDAIPLANAAGALTVTRAGAQPSLPFRSEVHALLRAATEEQLHGVSL
jgi:ribokinase